MSKRSEKRRERKRLGLPPPPQIIACPECGFTMRRDPVVYNSPFGHDRMTVCYNCPGCGSEYAEDQPANPPIAAKLAHEEHG